MDSRSPINHSRIHRSKIRYSSDPKASKTPDALIYGRGSYTREFDVLNDWGQFVKALMDWEEEGRHKEFMCSMRNEELLEPK